MTNWNSTCFIHQSDETKLFQTAMSISARSNLVLAKPSDFDPDTFESDLTDLLNSSDAEDYGINIIGGQTAKKIEEEHLPRYSFWRLQEYAFNKLIGYEACEYQPFIQKHEFSENLRTGGNYVMLIIPNKNTEPDQSKWINDIVTVLGYDGETDIVTYCDPKEQDGDNLQMSLSEFWECADSGGGLHYGIYFNPDQIKFSPNYRLNDFQYKEPFLNSDFRIKVIGEFETSKTTYQTVKDKTIPLSLAGANTYVLIDACQMADEKSSKLLACKKLVDLIGDFISTALYRNRPNPVILPDEELAE